MKIAITTHKDVRGKETKYLVVIPEQGEYEYISISPQAYNRLEKAGVTYLYHDE